MTLSVYGMTVPIFTRMLTNLLAIMDKAEANAGERKVDTLVLSNMRLAPDMIPFRGQVMIATDHVKGCVSRLAGLEGGDERQVTLKLGGKDVAMTGQAYLTERALPNFFFHVTTAYAILRHAGVPVGKRDYIG